MMANIVKHSKRARVSGMMLAAGLIAAVPCSAQTPPTQRGAGAGVPGEDLLQRRVSVNAEAANLASVLKTLMQGIGADYTLAPELRFVTVTAHLTNLPLRVALETVLKAGSAPATYHLENGVYFFTLRAETPVQPESGRDQRPTETPGAGSIRRVSVNYIDAGDVARLLGGMAIKIDGHSYGLVNPNAPGPFGPRGGGANAGASAGSPQGNLFDGSLILIGNAGAGFR